MNRAPLFSFKAGKSLLHQLDPRAKLGLVAMFSLTLAGAPWPGCLIFALVLGLGLREIGIRPWVLLRSLSTFILFLFLIVLVQGWAGEGPALAPFFPLSAHGLAQGALTALRFFCIMVLGLILSVTTRPSQLNAALQWVARPLPLIPEKRLGTIFGLALRFFPLILEKGAETRMALEARGLGRRKNPVQRLAILVQALMTRVFVSADQTAMAMEARGYCEDRTLPPLEPGGFEPLFLGAGAALCLVMALL